MFNSMQLHGLQHARLPCPSPAPRDCSDSSPLSQWCLPTISSCHPILLPPSIFPSISVFSNESVLCIRWPTYWSFSFSISPSNEYSDLISLRMKLVGSPCSQWDTQESSPTPQFKSINSLVLSFLYGPTLISVLLLEKPQIWLDGPLLQMSLLFNMLPKLVIAFLPRSKHLLISWLQ